MATLSQRKKDTMGRTSIPRETIVCVERILLEHSDADRGEYLTIHGIRELLKDHYGIDVSKDTVADCLEALGSETLSVPRKVALRASSSLVPPYELESLLGEKTNSPKRFAAKRLYPINQIKHLIRHLREDDPDSDSLNTERLLLKLVDQSTRDEFDDDIYNGDPLADAPTEAQGTSGLRALLTKVEILDRAIREKVKVRFTRPTKPNANPENWTPYLVAPSGGYYYLFVRPQGSSRKYNVLPFRVDTLSDLTRTDLTVGDYDAFEEEQATARRIFRAGIGRWFSRTTADIENVVVAPSKSACEESKKQRYLFEAMEDKDGFGQVGTTDDGRPQYRFQASHQAMVQWALKMSDLFELVSPEPWRQEVIDKLENQMARSAYGNLA